MPAGKADTFCAYRTPNGPSCKHSAGNPIADIAARFPTQGPFSHPTPVTKPIFWVVLSLASAVAALEYAEAHAGATVAALPDAVVVAPELVLEPTAVVDAELEGRH